MDILLIACLAWLFLAPCLIFGQNWLPNLAPGFEVTNLRLKAGQGFGICLLIFAAGYLLAVRWPGSMTFRFAAELFVVSFTVMVWADYLRRGPMPSEQSYP